MFTQYLDVYNNIWMFPTTFGCLQLYLDEGKNRRESQHQLQHQHQPQDIIGASSSVGEHLPISSKWSVKIPMAAPKQIQIPTRTNTSMHSNTNTHGSARRSRRIPPLLTEQSSEFYRFFCYFQQELLHVAIQTRDNKKQGLKPYEESKNRTNIRRKHC